MLDTLAMLKQGGWPMFPLAFCSLAALTIIIERAIMLRRAKIMRPPLFAVMEQYRGEASAKEAIVICQRTPGPFARLLEEIVKHRHLEHDHAIHTMHAVGRTQVGQLERGLTVLEIIAAITPLIGLLGTVLGMVQVFNAITASGLGNPQVLSDGIAKALITTIAGLIVAIPSLAFHSIFSKRVDELATDMQEHATAFIVKLQSMKE